MVERYEKYQYHCVQDDQVLHNIDPRYMSLFAGYGSGIIIQVGYILLRAETWHSR